MKLKHWQAVLLIIGISSAICIPTIGFTVWKINQHYNEITPILLINDSFYIRFGCRDTENYTGDGSITVIFPNPVIEEEQKFGSDWFYQAYRVANYEEFATISWTISIEYKEPLEDYNVLFLFYGFFIDNDTWDDNDFQFIGVNDDFASNAAIVSLDYHWEYTFADCYGIMMMILMKEGKF